MADIIAGIDGDNQIRVEAEIIGLYKSQVYGGIVDTGFSGSIVLPLEIAVDLGLTKTGSGSVMLADGSVKILPLFLCRVKIGDIEQDADVMIMGSDVLMGMGILDQFRLCLTAISGEVSLEPATEEVKKYSGLVDIMRKLTGRPQWS